MSKTLKSAIGWHVSSSMDWMKLLNHLGGYQIAGNKLKEPGTAHWGSPNKNATNKSGFSALAGGWRDGYNGSFQLLKGAGYWWTSTYVPGPNPIPVSPGDQCGPWMIVMFGGQSSVKSNNPFPKVMGFSIRCIKV